MIEKSITIKPNMIMIKIIINAIKGNRTHSGLISCTLYGSPRYNA